MKYLLEVGSCRCNFWPPPSFFFLNSSWEFADFCDEILISRGVVDVALPFSCKKSEKVLTQLLLNAQYIAYELEDILKSGAISATEKRDNW